MLKNKNILIFGFGVTGKSALKFLSDFPCKIYIYDKNLKIEDLKVSENFIVFEESDLDDIDLIIKSPGIYPDHEILKKARNLNIEIISDVELAYRFLENKNIVAITGTNGKTTTTTLVGEILSKEREAYVVGNIGRGILDIMNEVSKDDFVVIEASSFQLEDTLKFKPKVALLTYVTSDHLDWHKTVENYQNAKFKIFANQDENDFAIINYEDRELADKYNIKSKKYYFSTSKFEGSGAFLDNGEIFFIENNNISKIINVSDIKIPGIHNLKNIMGAIIIAKIFGINDNVIRDTISSFSGVEHRIEFVDKINDVKYYNDSKGTNPDSTEVAINAMDGDVILIAGGYDKGANFDNLIKNSKDKLKCVVLYGQTAEKISSICNVYGVKSYVVENLDKAMKLSEKFARKGESILFSPACASWDMYNNYEERGCHFKKLVRELKKSET